MTPSPAPHRDLHIHRRDNPGVWIVRATWRDAPVRREFLDSVFGGSQKALEAARLWRNAQPWYAPEVDAQAGPGVDEVRRYESQLPGNNHVSAFWYASWTDAEGRRTQRKFSVAFWGEDMARQKALEVQAEFQRLVDQLRAKARPAGAKRGRKPKGAEAPSPDEGS